MANLLRILLVNDLKTDYRSWRKFVLEIVIVVIFFTIVVINPIAYLTYEEANENQTNIYNKQELDLSHFAQLTNMLRSPLRYSLAYAPEEPFAKKITIAVVESLNLEAAIGFETPKHMETMFDKRVMLAGVEYPRVEDGDVPESLTVHIRFPSDFRTVDSPITQENLWITRCNGFLTPNEDDPDENKHMDLYLREGFLALQNQIFLQWYHMLKETYPTDYLMPNISTRSFRHHNDYNNCQLTGTSNLTSFLYYFVLMVPFLNMIWRYGREREENMLAHHWKYGYGYYTYWWAHFIVSFIHLFILDLIILILLKVSWTNNSMSGTFRDISCTSLLLFLVLYSIAMIVFVMFLVSFIENAKNAVLLGAVLWLSTYALLSTTLTHRADLTTPLAIGSLVLFFNSSFAYGMAYLKNISEVTDRGHIWILFGSMIANIIVGLCLLAVVQFFRPGCLMERKSLSICQLFRNQRKQNAAKLRMRKTISLLERTPSWQNLELGPFGGDDYMRLKNVCTQAKRDSRATFLKNISMRIYVGEITVILGPDCVGKTTLIRVMGGFQKPENGLVEINDKDIYENWKEARSFIDVCMPSNTLLDLLTASESLQYHIRIKVSEISALILEIEVQKWLQMLKPIITNGDMLVKNMNFGQKRLLCLCCTFAGSTKIVLLDEPTLHLRRRETKILWSILQREKPDRAIVLTTNSVEEAEAVGDRIALLNNGILKAYGTPFFLKTKYGVGYDLIISKEPKAPSKPITEFLGKFISNIMPENEMGDQLTYKVPEHKRSIFQKMLIYLEKESKSLGITNIRMVGAELSEAYMTIDKRKNQRGTDKKNCDKVVYVLAEDIRKQQFSAMLYKKMLYQAPNIIPLIMISVSVLLILFIGQLTKDFVVPSVRHNIIDIGFSGSTTNRSDILGDTEHCSFVDINYVETEKLFIKTNTKARVFTNESLKCEDGTHASKTKSYEKYGGVELNEDNFTAWYNQRNFHTAPLTMNLLHNIILQNSYPNNNTIMFKVVNDPMLIPLRSKVDLLDQQLSHLRVPLTIGIIIPITVSCFILFVVEERQSHMLLLQKMAGIQMDIYWVVNFLWDWGTYLVYSIIFILVMTLNTIDGFGLYEKMLTLLLINVYGITGLVMTYLISQFFYSSPLRSFLVAIIIQLLTGLCAYVFYWDIIEANTTFFIIASFAPSFALLDGISNIYTQNKEQEYCRATCERFKGCSLDSICEFSPQCCGETYFKWKDPGILVSMLYMFVSLILFMLAIFLVELHRREKKFLPPRNIKQLRSVCYNYDDADVINIKKYIADADMRECRQYRFVVDQLENRIPANSKELQTASFAVDKSVCLSIFGARHAGKTHLVKQFIGEHGFSFGDVYIKGLEVKYDLSDAYADVSFCPQDGGYFRLFTPRDLLRVFGLIRGIRNDQITEKIRDVAFSLHINKYMNKVIGELSFDKRRKVAIALALLAHNDVIILDEPTRGLPAKTRRQIWSVLRQERLCEKTVIFTSTEAMECEAIANEIILFNDGEMWAIGSTQYLRQKFTKGFFLEIKLKRAGSTKEEAYTNFLKDVENLNRFVSYLHEESELRSRVDNLLKYYVPVERVKYSYLYGALEKNCRRLNISDYTVSQGTMEDVLHNIAATRQSH